MIHILVVEDEKAISKLICLSLSKEGYHCTCAFDGAEAADLLERNQYELISNEEVYVLMKENSGWAEPCLVIAEDGSTALVWHCYWKTSPCVVAVDDASGKAVQFLIDSPVWLEKQGDKGRPDRREQWNLFFWDYYGEELEDMEGASLNLYEDYTGFNF